MMFGFASNLPAPKPSSGGISAGGIASLATGLISSLIPAPKNPNTKPEYQAGYYVNESAWYPQGQQQQQQAQDQTGQAQTTGLGIDNNTLLIGGLLLGGVLLVTLTKR